MAAPLRSPSCGLPRRPHTAFGHPFTASSTSRLRHTAVRPARHPTKLAAAPSGDDASPPSSVPSVDPTSSKEPTTEPIDAAASTPEATTTVEAAKAVDAAPTGAITWRGLLQLCWSNVTRNLWPLLAVHFVCDALVFCLHRASHRVTNEAAVALLGGGALTPAAIGNMWWLTADPGIANFQTGYQALTLTVFLLAFPLNVLLKTLASAATILICAQDAGKDVPSTPWWRPILGLKRGVPAVKAVWPAVAALWRRVFAVELLVSAAVIPLQFASLAVITLPLTLPLLLSLHAAAPAAVLEGRRGWDAIKRSRDLVRPIRWALAVPFVGLVVGQRAADAGKTQLLGAMPPRFYKELVELPAVILIGGAVLAIVLARMQDVLPFVAYSEATRREKEAGESGDGAVVASAAS